MPIRAELRVTARGLKLLGKLSAGPTRARAVAQTAINSTLKRSKPKAVRAVRAVRAQVALPEHDPQTHTVRWDGVQWVVEAIPMQAQAGAAVQAMIDAVCTSGVPYFRDIFSARGYVGDPNPAYHARAVTLRDWSSSVWTTLDEIQADVMAGNRPLPTLTELLAELPQAPV